MADRGAKYALDPVFLVAPSSTDARLARRRRTSARLHLRRLDDGCHRRARPRSVGRAELVARVRAVTDMPVAVGLGVSTGARLLRWPAMPTGSSWAPLSSGRCWMHPPSATASPRCAALAAELAERGACAGHDDDHRFHPEPVRGRGAPRAAAASWLRAVHRPRRHRRGLIIAERRLRARGAPGARPRPGDLGGAVRHHRRPALPRHHHAGSVLRQGRPPRSRRCTSGAAASASGARSPAVALGAVSSLPPSRDSVQHRRRCRRARPRGGAGDRPLGQLVQPGALRPRRPACPGRCTSTRRTGCDYQSLDLPADVPLRVDLVPRRRALCIWAGQAVPARRRPGFRAVRRGVLRRSRSGSSRCGSTPRTASSGCG